MPQSNVEYTPPGPIAKAFIEDSSFISAIKGPVGSGKSTASIMKLMKFSLQQKPYERVRRTRWVCVRNTYGELKSTTIETFKNWFEGAVTFKWSESPITAQMDFWLPDKTRVMVDWWFMALDRPDDLGRLRSLEPTGFWLNEVSQIGKSIANMATSRVGRYPPKKWGGADWRGIVMDTNPPDDDHWFYDMFEKPDLQAVEQVERKLREAGVIAPNQPYQAIFHQPGGLRKRADGVLEENPDAENIQWLDGGHAYYWQQLPHKTPDWVKVFVLGQYGTISTGKPVYPEWADDLHCRETAPYPDRPLLLGFDYGLTPACVFGQVSPRGHLIVLDELVSEDMGIQQFARDVVKPHVAQHYPGMQIQAVGDPAGMSRSQTEERTCFQELLDQGIPAIPAPTNEFVARREAVAKCLTKLIDGKPGIMVSPKCGMLRKGFNGHYQYDRIQIGGDERYKSVPRKNEASHIHDALQYLALYANHFGDHKWSDIPVLTRQITNKQAAGPRIAIA